MLLTVTNASSSVTLNALDTYTAGTGPAAISAQGGARVNQLPYPFSDVTIAPSGNLQRSCHMIDFSNKRLPWDTMTPGEQWNQLVQAGAVTLSVAAESTNRDTTDIVVHQI